jgi:hypothetical protein
MRSLFVETRSPFVATLSPVVARPSPVVPTLSRFVTCRDVLADVREARTIVNDLQASGQVRCAALRPGEHLLCAGRSRTALCIVRRRQVTSTSGVRTPAFSDGGHPCASSLSGPLAFSLVTPLLSQGRTRSPRERLPARSVAWRRRDAIGHDSAVGRDPNRVELERLPVPR